MPTILKRFRPPPIATDPVGVIMERLGELPTSSKDFKIEYFHENVIFAMRGFWSFTTLIGAGRYGPDLDEPPRRKPPHRELGTRKGIRVHLTNRIADDGPSLDWGVDYGSVPDLGALVLNDFTHWADTKLGDRRISGKKAGPKENRPVGIYHTNASTGGGVGFATLFTGRVTFRNVYIRGDFDGVA